MFQDLDATVEAVLTDTAAPAELRNADISFDTPDRDYKPTQAALNLFLHDVGENRTLRDNARVTALTGTTHAIGLPPLRVDCTYLVTAWSARTAGLKAREEHHLLGLALAWLSRFPLVEERFLQGALKNPPQPFPLPASVAQIKEGQSTGNFWTALGVPPRPAFSLTVTIAMLPFDEVERVPAAERIHIDTTLTGQPALAGRVLDHTLAPVASARVSVVGAGRESTVGSAGDFAFSGLDFGPYELLVRATNHAEVRKSVVYGARAQIHNVILPEP